MKSIDEIGAGIPVADRKVRMSRTGRVLAVLAAAGALLHPASFGGADARLHAMNPSEVFLLEAIEEVRANPVEVDWRTLAGLNYEKGEMTDELRALNGQDVKIPGFMVPLEDFAEEVTEFLLVPYFGACIHTPPPPPNQIVHVLMADDRLAKVEWWEPIWIEGTLRIEDIESIYGMSGYQIEGMRITAYGE